MPRAVENKRAIDSSRSVVFLWPRAGDAWVQNTEFEEKKTAGGFATAAPLISLVVAIPRMIG